MFFYLWHNIWRNYLAGLYKLETILNIKKKHNKKTKKQKQKKILCNLFIVIVIIYLK